MFASPDVVVQDPRDIKASQDGGPLLEDRLRHLIVGNIEKTTPVAPGGPQPLHGIEKQPINDKDGAGDATTGADLPSHQQSLGNKIGKKRPNQAQRRQMNAQMSIPIDLRAVEPPRPHGSSPGFQNQRPENGSQQNPARHHQVGFRGDSQRHMPSNAPIYGHTIPHQHQNQGRFGNRPHVSPSHNNHHGWRGSQPPHGSANSRGVNVLSAEAFASRAPRHVQGSMYNHGGHRQYVVKPEELAMQSGLLEELCSAVVNGAEIKPKEILEKENFRTHVEEICRAVITHQERNINGASWFQPQSVQLNCFGSLSSGFATKAADMDLGLLSPTSMLPPDSPESPIPRLVEKALLDAGFGARLLTRTRVPIIKLCETPTATLLLELRKEREKWENGLTDDDHDGMQDEADFDDSDNQEIETADFVADNDFPIAPQHAGSQFPCDKTPGQFRIQRPSLNKQAESQTLTSYYGNAKRALRRMDGRDITHSNAADFSDADFMILDDLSRAFIEGLRDLSLRSRILSYNSFSAGRKFPNQRTLYGVFMMVEGEKLITMWEAREVPERDPRLEQSCAKIVQGWRELQASRIFGVDPLAFNKELTMAVERLRQIPSIQLMQLRQNEYESPTEYHCRVVKMTTALNEIALASPGLGRAPPIVQLFVSGIRQDDIRSDVEQFVRSSGCHSLRVIARRHKSLHLAAEYEHAVEEGLYGEDDIPTIQQYIGLLRSSFIQAQPPYQTDYGLPTSETLGTLIGKIRELPDPSRLTPNQPRDRYHDKLEFPKSGVGVQCDINFSAHLGFQNSLLLRCYSYTDYRVRPLVLFVKHWAKARGINTPYRGTLSSYGYVLMVLHYLINIAQPFVCPNLQELAPLDPSVPAEALEGIATCKGRNVRFWRDEQEIQRLAREGVLTQNTESLGSLLRGFFEYYANNNMMSTIPKRGFEWGRDVLSIRTHGGLLSKQEKGWTGAKTVMQLQTGAPPTPTEIEHGNLRSPVGISIDLLATPDGQPDQVLLPDGTPNPSDPPSKPKEFKEVRHRYLFAVEDPFELEHNVARTVTHNGIVAIRDEFRRAWRIIKSTGKTALQEDLLEDVKVYEERMEKKRFVELLSEIHEGVMQPELK